MRIRFGTNPKLAIANIRTMKKRFLRGPALVGAARRASEEIKQIIAAKLQDDKYSTRDPQATKKGFGFSTGQIIAAITAEAYRKKLIIIGGVGRIEKLDANDPLLKLNNPPRVLRPTDRLWRILESGAIKHPITAHNLSIAPTSKVTHKGPGLKRKFSQELTEKGSKARRPSGKSQVPQLRFFWRKRNIPFRGPFVMHPGQKGRGIWRATAEYEARLLFQRAIFTELKRIVKEHSNK